MPPKHTQLDPHVFGPHYWFMLHTIAISYPLRPNAITKKKYHTFIMTLPLLLPNEKMASNFEKLLDLYPVTPYLDTRDSFIRWMHHIHNKLNEQLEKPKITLAQFYENYYNQYKPNDVKYKEYYKLISKIVYAIVIFACIGIIAYMYNK
jgi:hypothetical protein